MAAPVAVSGALLPAQIPVDGPMLTVGEGLMETVSTAVLLQPPASDPVTVYVVVLAGVAVTDAPVAADKPVEGLQL